MKKNSLVYLAFFLLLCFAACSETENETDGDVNDSDVQTEPSSDTDAAAASSSPGLKSYSVQEKADWLDITIEKAELFEKDGVHYIMVVPSMIFKSGTPENLHAMQEYHIWRDDTNNSEFIPTYDFAGEVAAANSSYGPGNSFFTINYRKSDKDFIYGSCLGGRVGEDCKQVTITFRYDTVDTAYQFIEFCKVTLVLD